MQAACRASDAWVSLRGTSDAPCWRRNSVAAMGSRPTIRRRRGALAPLRNSYRRSREGGNPWTLLGLRGRPWIPAFAGMTGFEFIARSGIGFRRANGFKARAAPSSKPPLSSPVAKPPYRRSRESGNPWTLLELHGRPWIPAFAGMTGFEFTARSRIGLRRADGFKPCAAPSSKPPLSSPVAKPPYRRSREGGNPVALHAKDQGAGFASQREPRLSSAGVMVMRARSDQAYSSSSPRLRTTTGATEACAVARPLPNASLPKDCPCERGAAP